MFTFIGIVSLVIIIIAIYQYRKSLVIEDKIEGFSSGYNWYGVPRKWKRDVLYISVIADDYLDIYHNPDNAQTSGQSPWKNFKWVGRARCCSRVYKFQVKDFKGGHKLMFFNYNGGGPGYFAGHLFINGKYHPLNAGTVNPESYQTYGRRSDYYEKTGKYLGCYRDRGNRRLPYYGYSATSFEGCQELALRRNHRYFGTQYGGECWTGNDLNRATNAGKVSDGYCRNKYSRAGNYVKWTQRYGLGGPWTNAIYDTKQVFDIQHWNNFSWRWFRNAQGGGWTRLIGYCPGIKPKYAGGNNQHSLWRWQLYSFSFPAEPAIVDFCPDKRYTEFNSGGCRDPTTSYTCSRSVNPNYKATMKACHNTFNVKANNYDNQDFFKIVSKGLKISIQHGWNGRYKNLKDQFIQVINFCCAIHANKDPYFDEKACKAKAWIWDMGYLNEMIDTAKEISDDHAMKNGKTSNKFLRGKLDESIKKLIDVSRDLIGLHEKECKCRDFEKINVYKYKGKLYCKSYESYIRHRGKEMRNVGNCKKKCDSLQGCDAIGVGEHCITYNKCKMSTTPQNWKWYTYSYPWKGWGKFRRRVKRTHTHGWYFYDKQFGKPDGQELIRKPSCKPC